MQTLPETRDIATSPMELQPEPQKTDQAPNTTKSLPSIIQQPPSANTQAFSAVPISAVDPQSTQVESKRNR